MKVCSSMFTFSKGHARLKHFLLMFIIPLPSNALDVRWEAEGTNHFRQALASVERLGYASMKNLSCGCP